MKNKIRVFVVGLIVISIVLSIGICIFILKSKNQSDLSNVVMAVASVINVIFILGFYIFDYIIRNFENIEEHEEKKEDKQREGEVYWYREFILEKNMTELINAFYKWTKMIDEIKKELEMEKRKHSDIDEYIAEKEKKKDIYCKKFNEEFGIIRDQTIAMCGIFSEDLRERLSQYIDEFETSFSDQLTGLFNYIGDDDQYLKIKYYLDTQKCELVKIFYHFGVQNNYI